MQLRDVVDLEAQLAADEGQDEATLRERERGLYLAMAPPPRAPAELLSAWLAALRERSAAPRLGEQALFAQRLLGYALVVSGLSFGWGLAEVLLHFEQGGAPVNVGYYLAVFALGQLATLLLMLLGLLLSRVWPRLPLLGDVSRLLRFLVARMQRWLRKAHPTRGEQLDAGSAALRRVQTRLGLYRPIERYLLLSQAQLFAVAFNLGALGSCLRLVLLSDLAFSWSTSVSSLDAAQVHRLCALLAWPFAWLIPDAVPTYALVEHTQYFRLEGRFAGAAAGSRGDAQLAGEWWRFLTACTVAYGLLPRMLALTVFWTRLRGALRDVPLDTPLVQRVLARMTTPTLSTRADRLSPASLEPAHVVEHGAHGAGGATELVLYRDIPTAPALLQRVVAQRFGVDVARVHRAGGLDVRADEALCAALRAAASVTLIAEAWEAPDKSLRNLLAMLRGALGPQRTLRVALIGEAHGGGFAQVDPQDARVYADRLTLLRDPYLIVETLPPLDAQPLREGEAAR